MKYKKAYRRDGIAMCVALGLTLSSDIFSRKLHFLVFTLIISENQVFKQKRVISEKKSFFFALKSGAQ